MKIYLARHGESEGNKNMLLYGRTDCPLTEKGREDAARLGKKLEELQISRCFASPLSRAADTARIALAGREVPITYLDGLVEQDMGIYENTLFRDLEASLSAEEREKLFDWTAFVPPEGETFRQMYERAVACLPEITEGGGDVLVVAHNGPLSAIIGSLLGATDLVMNALVMAHGCYSCVSTGPYRVTLQCFNK